MRVVFMGTPDFGVPIINRIIESRHTLIAVVCQPDKLGNRRKLCPPPCKVEAQRLGIDVYQYNSVSKEGVKELKALDADIFITAAYGQILSDEILSLPKYGIINVHASLLPKYRGSSPIHHAIINGETKTGITIMQTAKSVDSGDIIYQKELDINPDDTTSTLFDKLSKLGASVIVDVLNSIEDCTAVYTPQDHNQATHYPMLSKKDGEMDFHKTAKQLVDFVRGMNPWPCATMNIDAITYKVHKISVYNTSCKSQVGMIIQADCKNGLVISTEDGAISIDEIQPQGKRIMSAKDFLLGANIDVSSKLC